MRTTIIISGEMLADAKTLDVPLTFENMWGVSIRPAPHSARLIDKLAFAKNRSSSPGLPDVVDVIAVGRKADKPFGDAVKGDTIEVVGTLMGQTSLARDGKRLCNGVEASDIEKVNKEN